MAKNKLKAALVTVAGTTEKSAKPEPVETAAKARKAGKDPQLVAGVQGGIGRPDRAGRVLIGGHFEGELARRWNILAAELGVTKQELLRRAILDALEKHNAR